jgi:hypothetical protein
MARAGMVEIGFNEETLAAIANLQKTVDQFTPASGGFAEVPGNAWSDGHYMPSHMVFDDFEEGRISFSASMSDPDDNVPFVIRDVDAIDSLIGLLIHLRRRAFGHE